MTSQKTFSVSCKSSTKSQRWSRKERFSMGHDRTSRALITDVFPETTKPRRIPSTRHIGVYRSPFFKMTVEDRLVSDAKYLLETGRAETIEEAVQKVLESRRMNG